MADALTTMDKIHKNCAEIADLAQGLSNVLENVLDGQSEYQICELTLHRIMELADEFV